jgi:hypothetical protein
MPLSFCLVDFRTPLGGDIGLPTQSFSPFWTGSGATME